MNFKYIIFLACIVSVTLNAQKTINISGLKCENRINPIGVMAQHPNFSWQLNSDSRSFFQTAYRVLVSNDADKLAGNIGNVWDSKKVKSDKSIMVSYNGINLQPGKIYYWKVMVWDGAGNASGWSAPVSFQMGLLSPSDWGNAKWIGMEELPEAMRVVPGVHGNGDKLGHRALQRTSSPILRKEFEVRHDIASATLFISGLGHYEAYINGQIIGNSFLAPGWTHYDKTVLYNAFDVTSLLKPGANAIAAILGNGFYNINRERYRKLVIAYGEPKLISKISIVYTNGETDEYVTNESWKVMASPITFTSIYSGEDYDARMEMPGWATVSFDESCMKLAKQVSPPKGALKPEIDYPVAIKDELSAKDVKKLTDGKYLYDFGQNASGTIEIKVKGKRGQVVRFIPSELINANNEANQTATGRWYYYTYTLKGDGIEVWRPKFTYYGFRYVQVEGAAPDSAKSAGDFVQLMGLKLLHTCNSAPSNGSFHCSNELFNRIYPLINWAIRSNMQSVLTDCPHREKLGWLEQTFLMGASINYNYDIYNLYRKIVMDMMDGQTADGLVPSIVPEYVVFDGGFRDSPEWGSASVILPYLLYKWYGDVRVMEQAWPMMTRYVDYLAKSSKGNILLHGLGDWFDLGPNHPGFAQLTPIEVTATSIYYYDLKLLSEMAGLLNKSKERERYLKWAEEVRKSFNAKFFNPLTCVYSTGSQTAMAMPLCFDMVDAKYKDKVISNLVDSIKMNNKALTAGDIGFHYLVEALVKSGNSQLLFDMNNRDDVPGYGYQLKKGATALTESWQALENVSNNHLMLGHIMEWFYNGIGGIKQDESGVAFKKIIIKPLVVGDLTSARTSFHSPYGTIATDWKKENATLNLNVLIPGNTTALIYIPSMQGKGIKEGNVAINQVKEIKYIRTEGEYSVYQVGSGYYNFEVK